jgi:hypothetical protein
VAIRRFLAHWRNDSRPWGDNLGTNFVFSSLCDLPAGVTDFRIYSGDLYLAEMERDNVLTSSMVVRREAAGAALHFAEDLPASED